MKKFDQWTEGVIFCGIFAAIIIIPCIAIAFIGRNMINKLGQYPSKTPAIQIGVLFQLLVIEVVGFMGLIGFYNFFAE